MQYFKPRKQSSQKLTILSEIRTPLFSQVEKDEQELQLGKVENLRVAVHNFDNILIPQNAVFSFWKQVGPPWKSRGFVLGRELRHGCIIPTIAGGICQLSNSIHQAALNSGMEIIERHSHSEDVQGAVFKRGDDATVFWNYVDLRFVAIKDIILNAYLDKTDLVVSISELNNE